MLLYRSTHRAHTPKTCFITLASLATDGSGSGRAGEIVRAGPPTRPQRPRLERRELAFEPAVSVAVSVAVSAAPGEYPAEPACRDPAEHDREEQRDIDDQQARHDSRAKYDKYGPTKTLRPVVGEFRT